MYAQVMLLEHQVRPFGWLEVPGFIFRGERELLYMSVPLIHQKKESLEIVCSPEVDLTPK